MKKLAALLLALTLSLGTLAAVATAADANPIDIAKQIVINANKNNKNLTQSQMNQINADIKRINVNKFNYIPMNSNCESLNVGVATSIILYELF